MLIQAYTLKGCVTPFSRNSALYSGTWYVLSLSSSGVGVSSLQGGYSVHTFTKLYKVDVLASANACFGCNVLQATV